MTTEAQETVEKTVAADTAAETATETAQAGTETSAAAETVKDTGKAETASGEAEKGESGKESAWPDDWREQLAGDDEAFLRHLKRYSSPKTFAKGFKEREDLIRSGKIKRDMPDASDEKAMAEWRKEQGIPDDPTGYKLPEAVTKRMTDEDKPILASFTDYAHKKGAPQAVIDVATEWYFDMTEHLAAERAAADNAAKEAAEDALRKDWAHGEYKANITLASRALEAIPGVGKSWTEFRGPDGLRLGDNPEFIAWAADFGRNQFGDATFANSDSERQHDGRKKELEGILRTDRPRYFREGLDKEYGEILQREEKRRK